MAPAVRRSLAARRQAALEIARLLEAHYGQAECALDHASAFQLLAATILSAQCTDERVNMVTPALFKKYPTAAKLARASPEDVEELVRSTGFFRNKATNLIAMAQALVDHHHGEVPQSLEDLVQLPGVGRKTANVVLGTVFGIASGIVVDTHVKRITHLLGLTKATQPEKIEADLIDVVASAIHPHRMPLDVISLGPGRQ